MNSVEFHRKLANFLNKNSKDMNKIDPPLHTLAKRFHIHEILNIRFRPFSGRKAPLLAQFVEEMLPVAQ